jgi:hypothetical protein
MGCMSTTEFARSEPVPRSPMHAIYINIRKEDQHSALRVQKRSETEDEEDKQMNILKPSKCATKTNKQLKRS